MKSSCYRTNLLLTVLAALAVLPCAPAAERGPNILWITAEDMNSNLGCYGDAFARTPNLDRFAQQAARYTHAFAVGPVCSPSRSCLITGLYATSLYTHNLRCQTRIPAAFKGFPAWLRQAGYFCSNNSKTDYNLDNERAYIQQAWNRSDPQAHWRQRQPGQPFFSVFNLMTTHQSRTSVWPHEQFQKEVQSRLAPDERADPAKAPLPPYYPDTPLARRMMARYYDCIRVMDAEAGRILKELADDGLADDTIVFFFGDNGAGLPRHKRLPHDSGMRVPLLIHFPQKYQYLSPEPPGRATPRLVSFVDFAPSLLSLCGLPAPAHMQGKPFLGSTPAPPRECVFGARDRVDEAVELSRLVRDGRWLYLRNYMPHLSWCQPEGYSDQSDFRQELRRLAAEGRLNAAQLSYAGPRKPLEELYDSEADPWQLRNLAADPRRRAVLEKMRSRLRAWLTDSRDLGFLPEEQVAARCRGKPPYEVLQQAENYPLERLLAAAELVGQPAAVPRQTELLRDQESGVRYWAAVGMRAVGQDASPAHAGLVAALKDPSPSVRIEAAGAVAALEAMPNPTALGVLTAALDGDSPHSALHAARALQLLGEKARPAFAAMRNKLAAINARNTGSDADLFLRFALEAALQPAETRP
jgi:uncharacterized sulfatase